MISKLNLIMEFKSKLLDFFGLFYIIVMLYINNAEMAEW